MLDGDDSAPAANGAGPLSADAGVTVSAAPLPAPPERRAWLGFPATPSIQAPGWTTEEVFPNLTFDFPVGLYEAPLTGYVFVNERDGKIFAFRKDPQVAENEFIAAFDHPLMGPVRQMGPMLQMSETPLRVQGPSPTLGEHTDEILRDLGYADEAIAALRDRGVLGTPLE